VPFKLDVEENI